METLVWECWTFKLLQVWGNSTAQVAIRDPEKSSTETLSRLMTATYPVASGTGSCLQHNPQKARASAVIKARDSHNMLLVKYSSFSRA